MERSFGWRQRPWSLVCGAALALSQACSDGARPPRPDGCSGHVGELPTADVGTPECRQAWVGELVINEVVLKPGGRDLDADGASNGHDELVELIVIADEPIHLGGAELRWSGKRRGGIVSSPCLAPGQAAVLVGSATGAFDLPPGALRIQLDRTLRLTDSGGLLSLHGGGSELGGVQLAAAGNASSGCVNREVDGQAWAPMVAYDSLARAHGANWSPGLCAGGDRFPHCLGDRAAYKAAPPRDPARPREGAERKR